MSLKKELNKLFKPWLNFIKVQFTKDYATRQKKASNSPEVIASITSYPARFKTLHLTLKSLLLQSAPVDRIVLWIANEDAHQIPQSTLKLQDQNLIEIRFTKDTRSYKKIIPALMNFPNDIIITFDDDVYYPNTTVEKLITLHRKHPKRVIANRTHEVMIDNQGDIKPYQFWHKNKNRTDKPEFNFQTGIGGVLYPPKSLSSQVLDESLFSQLAPHGDDIWLYWMMRLNGNYALQTNNNFKFTHWPFSQKFALYKQNVRKDGNDQQIQAMLEHFGSPIEMPIQNED